MEIFLIRLLQFILAISLLVVLHEGGHFFFSRLFGVRVERFFLFFDPGFHLFQFKPKNSDTTYGIGWLPLGGYCKISGMIDESVDTEQMKQPAQPYEFRSKPAWQRLLIMIGGVLVNFLLALFIYSMVLFTWGDSYIATKDMNMGMQFNEDAKALGLKDGDIPLSTDKGELKKFDMDFYRDLASAKSLTILRDGKQMTLSMPGDLDLLKMLKTEPRFVAPFIPAELDSVLAGSPAQKAGMVKGDRILALDGRSVATWNDMNDVRGRLQDKLMGCKTPTDSLKARNTTIVFQHKGSSVADTASIVLDAEMAIGAVKTTLATYYNPTTQEYSFLESFPAGAKYGIDILKGYVSDMKYVFTAEGAKSVGGFGAIGSMFPPVWDWHLFWLMTAFLSIILAFMNIIPIPALDGGHVLFLLYEMIFRRKPSEKFLVYAEYAGMILLFGLLIMANLNDVLRAFGIL